MSVPVRSRLRVQQGESNGFSFVVFMLEAGIVNRWRCGRVVCGFVICRVATQPSVLWCLDYLWASSHSPNIPILLLRRLQISLSSSAQTCGGRSIPNAVFRRSRYWITSLAISISPSTGGGVAELSASLRFAELLRNHQPCDVWTICEQAPISQTSQSCSFVVCKSLCLAQLKPAAVVRSSLFLVIKRLFLIHRDFRN